ncbi:MAG: hypothetical protein ACYDHN_11755 [Solirubrobacteraceae bacterium]
MTDTANEQPGFLNVVAPVSGTATLTNTTTGYTANEANYPRLEVDALYPSSSPVCGHQGKSVPEDGDVPIGLSGCPLFAVVPFYGGGAGLCAVRVAALRTTLTAACGGDSSEESLAGGQSINLVVEPDGSQGGGACEPQDDPGYLVLSGLFPAEAELTIATLRAPPKYWAVVSPDGDTSSCPQSARAAQKRATGQFSVPPLVPVIVSEPAGLVGCLI